MAVAMVLSIVVHGVLLAAGSLHVDLFTTDRDGKRASADAADRYLEERPLEVVRIRQATGAAPEAAAEAEGTPAVEATEIGRIARLSVAPQASPSAPSLTLDEVKTRPEGSMPTLVSRLAAAPASPRSELSRAVEFRAASRAAQDAERDRKRPARGGLERGRGSGGFSVQIGDADCDTPLGVFDDFAGSFGRGSFGGGF